jgi:hypothetical protein
MDMEPSFMAVSLQTAEDSGRGVNLLSCGGMGLNDLRRASSAAMRRCRLHMVAQRQRRQQQRQGYAGLSARAIASNWASGPSGRRVLAAACTGLCRLQRASMETKA